MKGKWKIPREEFLFRLSRALYPSILNVSFFSERDGNGG